MWVMKLRRGRGTTVLLEVFARCLNIACKDLGYVLVQMRAHDDAQAVDLLSVGRHRISRKDPSSFAHFVRDVEFVVTLDGLI